MPEPRKGENLAHYIGRFIGSAEAEKSFPDKKQRMAVAYSLYKRKKKGK